MKLKAEHLVLCAAALALSACHRAPQAPTGQVAATVGDREITVRELRAELVNAPAVPPSAQKTQQQAALNVIIERTILADVARKQGIDKDPDFVLLMERANDALLVQKLQAKIASNVPPPSSEAVAQFQSTNPDIFAERKIFDVEQIRMARPADADFLKKLQPMKTLDEVANFLTQNHVGFQRGTSSVDALGQNPNIIKAIVALPPTEVFIISAGDQVLINLIRNTRVQPLTGKSAKQYASNYLRAQNTQDAVRRQLGALIASGERNVQFAKDYQPPKKPAGISPSPTKGAVSKGG